MKLATLKDGTRDGQLAVVSRDLKTAHLADGIAPTLQRALDDWSFIAPQLDLLYQTINSGCGHRAFDFDPANCMAPLPRSSLRVAGASYLQQLERACKAAGTAVPATCATRRACTRAPATTSSAPTTTLPSHMSSGASTTRRASPPSRTTWPWVPRRTRRT